MPEFDLLEYERRVLNPSKAGQTPRAKNDRVLVDYRPGLPSLKPMPASSTARPTMGQRQVSGAKKAPAWAQQAIEAEQKYRKDFDAGQRGTGLMTDEGATPNANFAMNIPDAQRRIGSLAKKAIIGAVGGEEAAHYWSGVAHKADEAIAPFVPVAVAAASASPVANAGTATQFVANFVSGGFGGLSDELMPKTTKAMRDASPVQSGLVSGAENLGGMMVGFALTGGATPVGGNIAKNAVAYARGEESGLEALLDVGLNVGTLKAFGKAAGIASRGKRMLAMGAIGGGTDIVADVASGQPIDVGGAIGSAIVGGLFGIPGHGKTKLPTEISTSPHSEIPEVEHAVSEGSQPENSQQEHQGIPQREDIPANGSEVRESQSEQASSSGSPVGETTERGAQPEERQIERIAEPAPETPIVQPETAEIEQENSHVRENVVEQPVEVEQKAVEEHQESVVNNEIPEEHGIQTEPIGRTDGGDVEVQRSGVNDRVPSVGEDRENITEGQGPRTENIAGDRGDESIRQGEAPANENADVGQSNVEPRYYAGDEVTALPWGEEEVRGKVDDYRSTDKGTEYLIGDKWYHEADIKPVEEDFTPADGREIEPGSLAERKQAWQDIESEPPASPREYILRDIANGVKLSKEEAIKRTLSGLNKQEQNKNFLKSRLDESGQRDPKVKAHDLYVHDAISDFYSLDESSGSREIGDYSHEWTNELDDIIKSVDSSKHARDILIDDYLAAKNPGDDSFDFGANVGSGGGEEPPTVARGEKETVPEEAFGIRNSILDTLREGAGLGPRELLDKLEHKHPKLVEDANNATKDAPLKTDDFISDLVKNPRPLNDTEVAQLTVEGNRRIDQRRRAGDDVSAVREAVDSGKKTDADLKNAEAQYKIYDERFQEILRASAATGTESGRGLAARNILTKALGDTQYEYANMERDYSVRVKHGEKLTDAEKEKLHEQADKGAELRRDAESKQSAEREAYHEAKFHEALSSFVKEMESESKRAKEATRTGKLRSYVKKVIEEEDQYLLSRYGKLHAGIDPADFIHFTKWAGAQIIDKALKLADFVKLVAEKFPGLKADVEKLYTSGKEWGERNYQAAVKSDIGDILSKAGDKLTGRTIFKLLRVRFNEGVPKDELLQKVTDDLQKTHKGITEREVRDLFSDYGKTRTLSPLKDLSALRELRRLSQLQSKLDDLRSGKAAKRSGAQRDTPTPKEREMQKEINQLLKKHGLDKGDPAKRLVTRAEAIKTRQNNRIVDLDREIELLKSGKRPTQFDVGSIEYDTESQKLAEQIKAKTKERDTLRDALDAFEGKPKFTEEQRLKSATASVRRAITKTQDRIRDKVLTVAKKEGVSSPELEALRGHLKSLSGTLREMRDAAKPVKTLDEIERRKIEVATTAMEKRVAENERRIKEINLVPEKHPVSGVTSPHLVELRERNERLKVRIKELRDASDPSKTPEAKEQRRLDARVRQLEKLVSANEEKIRSGEIAGRAKKEPPTNERINALRSENEKLRDRIKRMRDEADPTKTPEAKRQRKIDSAMKQMNDRMDALEKEFRTGEKDEHASSKPETQETREMSALLKLMRSEIENIKNPPVPEVRRRQQNMLRAANKSAAEYRKLLNEGSPFRKKGEAVPETPELKQARETRDDLRELYKVQRDLNNPERVRQMKDEASIKATNKRTEKIKARIAAKDYAKEVKVPVEKSKAAKDATLNYERWKKQYDADVLKDQLANRSKGQKVWDALPMVNRAFVLSYPTTFVKIMASAIGNRLVGFATDEMVRAAFIKATDKLVPGLSAKADIEGTFTWKAFARNYESFFGEGIKDSIEKAVGIKDMALGKGGFRPTEIELLDPQYHPHGGGRFDIPGELHGVGKATSRRAMYEWALENLNKAARGAGEDPANPDVLSKNKTRAAEYSNRAQFTQKNAATQWWNVQKTYLKNKDTGTTRGLVRAMDFVLPVSGVPTNVFGEAMVRLGGWGSATRRVLQAYRNGIETLTPDQANLIYRHFSKGWVGPGMILLGVFDAMNGGHMADSFAHMFGGYKIRGAKETDLKQNDIEGVPDLLAHAISHLPHMMDVQLGATIVRAIMEQNAKSEAQQEKGEEGISDGMKLMHGLMAGGIGIVGNVPMVNLLSSIAGMMQTPAGMEYYMSQLARTALVPGLIQQAATWIDPEPLRRTPHGFLEYIEIGIPGLRETIPVTEQTRRKAEKKIWE